MSYGTFNGTGQWDSNVLWDIQWDITDLWDIQWDTDVLWDIQWDMLKGPVVKETMVKETNVPWDTYLTRMFYGTINGPRQWDRFM